MRILNRIAIAAVLALFVAAAVTPAQAACGSAALVSTTDATGNKSFIWNEGVFEATYCNGYPGYAPAGYYSPPVTAAFTADFWALGTGNPTLGAGDDNGAWGADQWFAYYALPTYSFYESAQIFTNWGAASAIDGCIFNSGPTGAPDPGEECTCVLLLDQDGTDGYYAMVANSTDAISDSYLTQPGNDCNNNAGSIILKAIPKPTISGATWRDPAGGGDGNVELSLVVSGDPGNYNLDPAVCGDCGPTAYKVMMFTTGRGLAAPITREVASWTEAPLVGGGAQPALGTPLGTGLSVETACGGDQDVYLATMLMFDSDYNAGYVSGDSTKVECGSTLADPVNLRPRLRPGTPPELRAPKRTR